MLSNSQSINLNGQIKPISIIRIRHGRYVNYAYSGTVRSQAGLQMQENSIPLPRQSGKYPRRRFAMMRSVLALMLREMATTYGRSPGGYIWAVLEPAGSIAVLSIAFSLLTRAPPLGINFSMFYATGMVPFLMYSTTTGKLATALLFSKQLLAYPSVTYIDAIVARLILNLLTQLMVSYIILSVAILMLDTRVLPDYVTILHSFALAAALGLGLGVLNAFLFTRFPVWQRAWSVLTRPLVLLSGIILLPESIPQPYQDYLWYNPVVHIVSLMRRGFYSSYDAPYVSSFYVLAISGISLLIGLIFLKRYYRDLLYL